MDPREPLGKVPTDGCGDSGHQPPVGPGPPSGGYAPGGAALGGGPGCTTGDGVAAPFHTSAPREVVPDGRGLWQARCRGMYSEVVRLGAPPMGRTSPFRTSRPVADGPLVALRPSPFGAQDGTDDVVMVAGYRLVRGPGGTLLGARAAPRRSVAPGSR